MNINQRIAAVMEHSELSASEFADLIEVQRSNISHITSGRNKPSLDFIVKIKNRFPELRWDWLIKGEGEMLDNPTVDRTKVQPASLPDLFSLIDDDNFGITESEDTIRRADTVQSEDPPEYKISAPSALQNEISDSQRLENQEDINTAQPTANEPNAIKRIILLYDNGKFESYEP